MLKKEDGQIRCRRWAHLIAGDDLTNLPQALISLTLISPPLLVPPFLFEVFPLPLLSLLLSLSALLEYRRSSPVC